MSLSIDLILSFFLSFHYVYSLSLSLSCFCLFFLHVYSPLSLTLYLFFPFVYSLYVYILHSTFSKKNILQSIFSFYMPILFLSHAFNLFFLQVYFLSFTRFLSFLSMCLCSPYISLSIFSFHMSILSLSLAISRSLSMSICLPSSVLCALNIIFHSKYLQNIYFLILRGARHQNDEALSLKVT